MKTPEMGGESPEKKRKTESATLEIYNIVRRHTLSSMSSVERIIYTEDMNKLISLAKIELIEDMKKNPEKSPKEIILEKSQIFDPGKSALVSPKKESFARQELENFFSD